ncbi:MAG TPA: GGDEF domain-containing protein [Vicinamibacterales bacterium]|nr:GGDEF domain-containing protein [Vicinamibacterales bacterium]
MAERLVHVNFMRPEQAPSSTHDSPQTRSELHSWIRDTLRLPTSVEHALVNAIDAVFTRHERLWQESKHEAIQALSAGFADKMARVKTELSAKDATVSSISRYFEALVADLTDRSHRDPKTKLMNFARFTEQLESFLALEQRGRWCAVGLVDITGFKWYNDALGHSVGDRIIERVAHLLREQVRSDDLLAQDAGTQTRSEDLHARFGGDEFCFLIPDLDEYHQAYSIGERFREAVERYDWATEDRRLAVQPVRCDVGVVCLSLGRVSERRFIARRLAADLIQRADKLMYEAKGERANHIYLVRARIDNGTLVDVTDHDTESAATPEPLE